MATLADAARLPGTELHADAIGGRYRMKSMDGVQLVLRPMREGGAQPGATDDLMSLKTVILDEVLLISAKGGDQASDS